MDLQSIDWNYIYTSSKDNIIDDFYKPALIVSKRYKRITGYFTAKFLENMGKEIKEGSEINDLYIQILCSPIITEEDKKNIEKGYGFREVISRTINNALDELEDDLSVLPFISEVIAKNILDIKFVIPKNNYGMFHAKQGVFEDRLGNKIAFNGSNNETINGAINNYETFTVFTSWKSNAYVEEIEESFDLIWDNKEPELIVENVTNIIADRINDYKFSEDNNNNAKNLERINIESMYDLHDYQHEAVKKWIDNGYNGLFEMATGTGKTVTALACYSRLAKEVEKLIAVIVVPQLELVDQWEEDIINAGGKAIKCHSGVNFWENILKTRTRRLSIEDSGYLNVLVTRDTFTSDKFLRTLTQYKNKYLLIADEVHSFGTNTVRKKISSIESIFSYKLGISATPYRRDIHESNRLINFFGGIVFSYSLKKAIQANYLNNYEYHPEIMFFDIESLEKYRNTYHLNKEGIENKETKALNEIERLTSSIAGSSISKIIKIKDSFNNREDQFQSIVYCSPGGYNDNVNKYDEKHIEVVSQKISEIDKIKLRMVRSQVKPEERQSILSQFKTGAINVLVAIKCLDQGINLPNVTDAYILSSTDSVTEFVQRRGRILRKYKGKPTSHIYDYIMLPQDYTDSLFDTDEADSYMVTRELRRMKEYSEGADNEEEIKDLIDKITDAYKDILMEDESYELYR